VHLRLTDSTNSRAYELARAGAPHGTLVSADQQSAGRGRHGRQWSAPPRSSVLISLVLRDPPALLPLLAAVAVCEVLGQDARIKWPNDVVLERSGGLAKLAGILAEGRPQEGWAVLGIGLNVAVRLEELPPQIRATAATLGGSREQIEPTVGLLVDSLQRRLAEEEGAILEAWRERDVLRGREVSWAGGQGCAAGIDGTGRLVVGLPDGTQLTLDAAEVHLESYSSA
jgi:BirA family biotin operon repressor/biotin-[acetyl-CoA-carboxylase] ligase